LGRIFVVEDDANNFLFDSGLIAASIAEAFNAPQDSLNFFVGLRGNHLSLSLSPSLPLSLSLKIPRKKYWLQDFFWAGFFCCRIFLGKIFLLKMMLIIFCLIQVL
jgi:hypothetical protein